MLAEAIGNFGEVALVRADRGEIVGLANEVKRSQGFPDLLRTGIDGADFRAGRNGSAGSDGKRANAAGDGRANL